MLQVPCRPASPLLVLLTWWVGYRQPAVAQAPTLDGWQVDASLRGLQVEDIVQAPGQMAWVATDAGVFRYDGPQQLVPLNVLRRGKTALPQGACYHLLLATDGQLWMGTTSGAFQFGVDGRVRAVPLPAPAYSLKTISQIALATDGRHVWLAQEQVGVRRYTLAGRPAGPLLPEPQVREIWPAPDGSLWVTSKEGGIHQYAPAGQLLGQWHHPSRDLHPVAEPGTHTVWLLSSARLYAPATNGQLVPGAAWQPQLQRRSANGPDPAFPQSPKLGHRYPEQPFQLMRHDSVLTAFTSEGIYQLSWTSKAGRAGKLRVRFSVAPPQAGALWAANIFRAQLRSDAAGNWWVINPDQRGVWTRRAGQTFIHALAGPGNQPYSTRAACRLPDGRLLVSAYNQRLLVQAADSPLAPLRPWVAAGAYSDKLPHTLRGIVPARAGSTRTDWLVASDVEFSTLNPRTGYLAPLPTQGLAHPGESPQALALAADPAPGGRVWGAANTGLYYYDAAAADFRPYQVPGGGATPLAGQIVEEVQPDGQGHLWLAGPAGVVRLTIATGEQLLFGPEAPDGPRRADLDGARCLWLDQARQQLWVGSRTQGLGCIDLRTGMARQVLSTANGLPHAHVASLVAGPDSALWLGTYAGIVRYSPSSGALAVYTTADGLSSDECNARSAYADPLTPSLLMGGIHGTHRVYPAQAVARNRQPFRLVLTAITLLDATVAAAYTHPRYLLAHDSLPPLILGPDRPVIDLHLALTDYSDPGQARFFYRMAGWLNGHWLPLGAAQVLRLQAVPPGSYTVEIRGETAQGVAATNTLRLPLTVTAEWWRRPTTWALGALLGLALTFWWQGSRLRRQRHDYDRRARLAADLHDEVGALLTRVAMQAELLRELKHAPPDQLDALVQDSRAAITTVRDIIWSVDVAADTLEALTDRIRDLLDQTARATGRPVHFTSEGLPPDNVHPLLTVVRQHVYLICKEAVTNALRHAPPGAAVGVTLRYTTQALELFVQNDAPPGNAETPVPGGRAGQGLRNMHERARLIRAELRAGHQPDGTWRVALRVPL